MKMRVWQTHASTSSGTHKFGILIVFAQALNYQLGPRQTQSQVLRYFDFMVIVNHV